MIAAAEPAGNPEWIWAAAHRLGIDAVDGMLFDLGVSSPQLDETQRGFSYMHDAPLDMRMDATSGLSAWNVVNEWPENELKRILYEYGEERYAPRIAGAIVRARAQRPISTTLELVDVIRSAMPGAALREKQHPAKRSFQAIRIAVNDELAAVREMMDTAPDKLRVGGRRERVRAPAVLRHERDSGQQQAEERPAHERRAAPGRERHRPGGGRSCRETAREPLDERRERDGREREPRQYDAHRIRLADIFDHFLRVDEIVDGDKIEIRMELLPKEEERRRGKRDEERKQHHQRAAQKDARPRAEQLPRQQEKERERQREGQPGRRIVEDAERERAERGARR